MAVKIKLEYDMLKAICIDMAQRIKEQFDPDEIVGISRGGLTPATIIAKELGLPCGVMFPQTEELHLVNKEARRIVFVEDLVAKGRTFQMISDSMEFHNPKVKWMFTPVLVDANYKDDFTIYGLKTASWIVFPWEDDSKVTVGDWGLFREGTAQYGKS